MLGKNINHYILRLKGLNVDEVGRFFFPFFKDTTLQSSHLFICVLISRYSSSLHWQGLNIILL